MRKKNLLQRLGSLITLTMLFSTVAKAQTIDATNTFSPALTGTTTVYAAVVLNDLGTIGTYDAGFALLGKANAGTMTAYSDYSCGIAFYNAGLAVYNGSYLRTNTIIPVPGKLYHLWITINVDAKTYKVYVLSDELTQPTLILDADATFRNQSVTEINRWAAFHNPSGQPDYLTVQYVGTDLEIGQLPPSWADPALKSLTSSTGTLSPEFDPATTEYTIEVPYGTTSVELTAVPNGVGASVTGAGTITLEDGYAYAQITVTSGSQEVREYVVEISEAGGDEDASLKSLTTDAGPIDPLFNRNVLAYKLYVPEGTSKVNVTALPTFGGATVQGTGEIILTDSKATANIVVTSQNGNNSTTYTLDIVPPDTNYAISLPGGNGTSSHIDISGLGLNSLPFTVEMWIKPEGNQTANSGLFFNRVSSSVSAGLQYASNWQQSDLDDPEKLRFMTNYTAEDYGVLTGSIPYDAWHHVAVVLTESKRIIYLDGVPTEDPDKTNAPYDFGQGKLYIGYDDGGTARAFKGLIDEIRVWNVEKTAQELDDSKYSVLNGNEPNLLAYWNFDVPHSIYAIEATGNGPNGLIAGGTYTGSFPRANIELKSLVLDKGTLKPNFSNGITQYYVTLPKGTVSLNVAAKAADATAVVTGAGDIDTSAGQGVITVKVTTANGLYSNECKIQYVVDTDLTLTHSYTFADGTAKDVTGGANGTVNGGQIVDGSFVSSENGHYIVLPAAQIAINKYPSVTLEAYATAGTNTGYTMLAYFGGLHGSNSLWLQPTRGGTDASRFEINTGVIINAEGPEAGAGELHHYVGVVSDDAISLYIDGILSATAPLTETSVIGKISTANAWLCYGGYSDPTWIGYLHEFNIYSGQMDEATIAQRASNVPQDPMDVIAILSDLTVDGVTITGFASAKLTYDVVLPAGTTAIPQVDGVLMDLDGSLNVTQAATLPGTATLLVTAEDGTTTNTYTVNFIVEGTATSVKPNKGAEVVVYPTVSKGSFTVKTDGQAGSITVFDITGKVIGRQTATGAEQTVSIARAGIYILKVETAAGTKMVKVIVTK
ncbi:MAG: cadherin-like beta sandwich domain-containing protein [Breznakibacter sp.]